jgi:hypothetical protein
LFYVGGQWQGQDGDDDRVLRLVQGYIGEAGMAVVRGWVSFEAIKAEY